jgi:AmiR/NasT family two-component response regulator
MKRRVLVIDDHLPSRTFLVKALSGRGFTLVGEGSTGTEAAGLARTTAPDVVLMAVGLPDGDGISVAREIVEHNPLPIVLLTSHHDAETIERAKGILMKSQGLSEAEAFSLIQKKSMDMRKSMAEIARAIILNEELTR